MITAPAGVKVLVATKPVDFRKGADGLVALVREQIQHDPFCGAIFIFRSKRADRLKILAWDGSGLVLLWNYMHSYYSSFSSSSGFSMRYSGRRLDRRADSIGCIACAASSIQESRIGNSARCRHAW